MVRKLVLSLIAVLGVSFAIAQNKQISGTVTDASGHAVVGATVMVEGTSTGTTTGSNGYFVLQAPANGKLVFSFIGHVPQTVAIAGKTTVNVTLEEDTTAIEDVVVIAYGTSSKEAVTGSVSMVKSEAIEKRTASDVTSTLEGATAGVQVSSSYGEPGSTADILIRGFGSINGNNTPLYVVDGNIFAGSMNDLNPNDIESISVLKDAASAALYGSRAASGVVLITTKKGKSAGKLNVNVSTKQGVYTRGLKDYETLSADPWMEVMWNTLYNDYNLAMAGQSQADIRNAVNNDIITGYIQRNIYDAADNAVFDANGKVVAAQLPGYTDLDWMDAIEETGYRGEYNIQADAAGDKFDIFASIGYLNEDGYIKNTNFERTTGRLSANFTPKSWFKTGINLSGSLQKNNFHGMAYSSYHANPFYSARMMAPVYPVYVHDDAGNIVYENGKPVFDTESAYLSNRSIAYELEKDYDRTHRTTLNASAYATVTFLKDFDFTVRASVDRRNSDSQTYNNPEIGDGASNGGRLEKTFYKYNTINFQQQLTYTKEIGKHHVDAMVGHENYQWDYNYDYAMKIGQSLPTHVFDGFATMQYIDGYTHQTRTESYLGRARYNYDNRYFVEGSYRRDGSSRFHKDSRWGNFWSVGASWVVSSEQFMANADWVDFLKVRASYGEVGNDASAGYYAYSSIYGAGMTNGGNSTIIASQLGNPNLQWETTQSFDIGVDARLWNRVDVTLDYFRKTSKDLLFDVKMAPSVGTLSPSDAYPSVTQNIGSVLNSGIEVAVNVDIIKTKDWKWDMGFNASFVKNEIKELPLSVGEKGNGYISDLYRFEEGHSMYEFYTYQYQGVDQMTGRALYAFDSENNDPVADKLVEGLDYVNINGTDYALTTTYAKRDWAGEALPDVYGGLQTNVSWKNLSMNILCSYSIGGKIYDSTYRTLMYPYLKGPQALHQDILNSWTAVPEGMTATSANRVSKGVLPMNDTTNANHTYAASDRWLVDASYFMVKNIGLSYNLPKKWMSKLGLGACTVSFNVENPFIFTKRDGLNPQYSFYGGQDQTYVAARIYTFGLNLKL